MAEKRDYAIESQGAQVVTVEYSVKTGAFGKHGHIGYLDERFGLTAGKDIFLFPVNESTCNTIAVEFILPQGWEAVCPWKKEGSRFIIKRNYSGYKLTLAEILGEAVIGFGNFKVCQKDLNGFNVRIYTYAGWPDEHAGAICEQAFKLAQYQLDLFGFDRAWNYTVIFVPSAADKRRIFGGCYSFGQGYEMDVLTIRRWELFSHRVHHVFNKYPPLGLNTSLKLNRWFLECTPTYYEVRSLAALGYYKVEDGLAKLKRQYDEEKPKYDVPLSMDFRKRFDTVEFLHYRKAPLVGYLIDEKIKKDTNGAKDLDAFVKYIYSRYGMKRGAMNPKEELERFTGSDFTGFYASYVDGTERIDLRFGSKKYAVAAAVVIITGGVWIFLKFRPVKKRRKR